MNKTIGIIGGLGPLATVKFAEILTDYINKLDYKNIDILIINDPTTPDRTQYILDNNNPSPLPNILEMVKKLDKYNVDIIVMPCNTASYFYDEIIKQTSTLFINIVEETVKYIYENNPSVKKVGLLATTGTIRSLVYKNFLDKYGIECVPLDDYDQNKIMSIIYDGVKGGREFDINDIYKISEKLKNKGCEKIILGCTELSVLYKNKIIEGSEFVDSMEVLAKNTISKIEQ